MTSEVKWLLETEVFQDESDQLVTTLKEMGIPHKVCTFGKPYEDYLTEFAEEDCVVFHGSLQFAHLLQRKAKWIPGVYCNLPKFEATYYYPRFGKHLLNSEYIMLPFGDLRRRKGFLYCVVGRNGHLFVRPNSGFKTFTGFVVSEQDFEKEMKGLALRLDPEQLILAAEPVQIGREWRLVVVGNQVVAATQYKHGHDLTRTRDVPQEVLDYGQEVVNTVNYQPDRAWTLDICESGERLWVLEVGSFSCAGLYDCDPKKVIEAVNAVALKEWQEYQA